MHNQKTESTNVTLAAGTPTAAVIKLGLDVHQRQITVCRQLDGSTPQPPQRFTREKLLGWIKTQADSGAKVFTCYEAGCFGYGLHRDLTRLGVVNYVVTPQNWDERGKGVKTDRTDARALVDRLDRYVRGNIRAFSVVRVPSEAQEQARALVRLRAQLLRDRKRAVMRGKSLLLAHGIAAEGQWWRPTAWKALAATLPAWLKPLLTVWQELAQNLDAQERALTERIEAEAPRDVPYGVGALTWMTLLREVLDWSRFKNRRQVASYTGLCPSVHQSDGKGRQGSINRCGNAAIRHALVELVWRLVRYQPRYRPVRTLVDRTLSGRQRRKHAVAAARRVAIDLWRLATGQTTTEKLGLIVATAAH